ncbi:DUF2336 domain-containing protein [Bosea sp. PAMC 26642]|uniref:DUF2336 domain-containing protein n=1 Tax=Bosea sp. (strain PAMC 26642) TaxID=1792307 RepID=UPI0007701710|nr:DUF2336 domain-containing protein [Bosea sp. PAMC 26642]AMJ59520.1 hypothetical protein AXW83_03655 [Bosea sp. PAMC 26642]
MLHALFQLAAETSSEARRRLLHAVTDLFFYDPEPTVMSKHHYGEIALRSLPHLDTDARQTYADEVAGEPHLPRAVANALAGDPESGVARLVLRLSPVLTDGDLAAIALNQSQGHLTAIAERARIPESVTEILVERGDHGVLKTVGGNEGAAFSDTGFDRLLERGRRELDIPRAIVVRSDLTDDRAERVMRMLAELGEVQDLELKPVSEAASMARQARQQRLEVTLLIDDLAQKTRALDSVLIMLAEEDRAYHLVQVIAQTAEIPVEHVLRALLRRDASGIALACRALDVSVPAFAAILELRARRLMFAKNAVEDNLRHYAKIDVAAAERAMRHIRMKAKAGRA